MSPPPNLVGRGPVSWGRTPLRVSQQTGGDHAVTPLAYAPTGITPERRGGHDRGVVQRRPPRPPERVRDLRFGVPRATAAIRGLRSEACDPRPAIRGC